MTQFKEKSSTQKEHVSVGLFDYPALMAADILLYDTDFVPVGEDQRQHLELTRDIAKRFNALYGETFAIPDPLFPETSIRIMGLDDPFKKMSKTITEAGHAIHILDPPDDIYSKVQNARTDSLHEIDFENAGAGVRNLLTIYKLFSEFDDSEIKNHFSGKRYMFLKKELADLIIENLRPIQKRFTGLLMDMASIEILLEESAGKLIPVAETKLKMVRDKTGIG
jgi:tryptophanyl-tRNA synthetase